MGNCLGCMQDDSEQRTGNSANSSAAHPTQTNSTNSSAAHPTQTNSLWSSAAHPTQTNSTNSSAAHPTQTNSLWSSAAHPTQTNSIWSSAAHPTQTNSLWSSAAHPTQTNSIWSSAAHPTQTNSLWSSASHPTQTNSIWSSAGNTAGQSNKYLTGYNPEISTAYPTEYDLVDTTVSNKSTKTTIRNPSASILGYVSTPQSTVESTNTSNVHTRYATGPSEGYTTGNSMGYTTNNCAGYAIEHSTGYTAQNVKKNATESQAITHTGHSISQATNTSNAYKTGYSKDSPTQNSVQGTVVFYHYTNSAGVTAIRNSGYIKESSEDSPYAHFGEGVYGTNLPPSTGKMAIAKNNWNNGGPANKRRGRVDFAIRVYIPKCLVTDCSTRNRDLLLHKGRLYLDDYKWDVVRVN